MILRAVVRFWDPEFYIFKFGSALEELYHIIEEFKALLRSTKKSKVIYCNILKRYVNSMASLIMVHGDTLLPMLQGFTIKLTNIVRLYSAPDDATNKEYIYFHHQVLSFYLVSCYLLFLLTFNMATFEFLLLLILSKLRIVLSLPYFGKLLIGWT